VQCGGNPYPVASIVWAITTTISPRHTGAAVSRAQHLVLGAADMASEIALEGVAPEVREIYLTFYTSVPRKEKSVSLGTLGITRYHKQRYDAHNHHELEHAL
jgi:hypothetical protein